MAIADTSTKSLAQYLRAKCERTRDLELDSPVGDKPRTFIYCVLDRMDRAMAGIAEHWRIALDVQPGGKRALLVMDDGVTTATMPLAWSEKLLSARNRGSVALIGHDARRRVVGMLADIIAERMGVAA